MKSAFWLICCVLLLFSCSSALYYPGGVNAPLLKEKHDIHLNASVRGLGVDLHSAYALSDIFALQFNANAIGFESTEFGEEYKSGQYYAEVAAGFYKPLSQVFVVEQFIGLGTGQSFSRDINSGVLRTTNITKTHIQLDAGFRWPFFSLGLAAREAFIYAAPSRYDSVPEGLSKAALFFEPFIFLGIGPEKFKINAQAGLSIAHFAAMSYSPFILSAGIETRF